MRQEAIKQAEKERRDKYKKQEEEREVLRQGIREKVVTALLPSHFGSRHIVRKFTFTECPFLFTKSYSLKAWLG